MGMAASQARFLNLTARRTNIEYQGQQINQQRTELANQSASLYNQMLSLQVPVPPNTQDYTKVVYTFNIPGNYDTVATVSQFSKDQNGTYTVLFSYTQTELGFPPCTTSQRSNVEDITATTDRVPIGITGGNAPYGWVDGTTKKLRLGSNDYTINPIPSNTTDAEQLAALANGFAYFATVSGNYYMTEEAYNGITATSTQTAGQVNCAKMSGTGHPSYNNQNIQTYNGKTATLKVLSGNEPAHKDAYDALMLLCDSENMSRDDESIYVANVGTEENPSYQYYRGSEIRDANITGDGRVLYYVAGDVDIYKEDSYSGVTLNRDGNGRVQSFNYRAEDYAITANTVTDDEAYDQAMNEYTYKSYLYQQEMNNINAKTSIVQVQDRELELKLKQLDTEHNAVQTEIDAVQSVCKKNTEDSFKTFG